MSLILLNLTIFCTKSYLQIVFFSRRHHLHIGCLRIRFYLDFKIQIIFLILDSDSKWLQSSWIRVRFFLN